MDHVSIITAEGSAQHALESLGWQQIQAQVASYAALSVVHTYMYTLQNKVGLF